MSKKLTYTLRHYYENSNLQRPLHGAYGPYETVCGIKLNPNDLWWLEYNIEEITCKKCLKIINNKQKH